MLYQNSSFDNLTGIQPWSIAQMLLTKVPTPKTAMRSTDRQPLNVRPLKNFLPVSMSISLLQEKCPFPSGECRFFLTQHLFFNLYETAVLPKWQPEAMTSTDVENSTLNMVLRSGWPRGMVQQSFTGSLLSLPSITWLLCYLHSPSAVLLD